MQRDQGDLKLAPAIDEPLAQAMGALLGILGHDLEFPSQRHRSVDLLVSQVGALIRSGDGGLLPCLLCLLEKEPFRSKPRLSRSATELRPSTHST